MKMRKKLISGVMALSLLAAMSSTALAESPIKAIGGSDDKEVKGTYQSGAADTVYSVEVSWGSMEFTYSEGTQGTWNPGDHSYSGAAGASWSCEADANKVTVVNHSNAPVAMELSFTGTGGVTGDLYDSAATDGTANTVSIFTLPTAEGKPTTDPDLSKSAWLQITGGAISANGTIGSITVTLKS